MSLSVTASVIEPPPAKEKKRPLTVFEPESVTPETPTRLWSIVPLSEVPRLPFWSVPAPPSASRG